jgi:mersacidin/lichenicidin family type 2 lantibiotic
VAIKLGVRSLQKSIHNRRAEGPKSKKGENTMSHRDIIRAWKDAEFRSSLSEAERAMLPANPAGAIDLADSELDHVAGKSSGLRVRTHLKGGTVIDECKTY